MNNIPGNSLVFDVVTIMVAPVSDTQHSWTIVCDLPFTVFLDDHERITSSYGDQFTYHKSNFLARHGQLVKLEVECADGPMTIEVRK